MNTVPQTVEEQLHRLNSSLTSATRRTLARMYSAGVLDGTEQKNRQIGKERISPIQGSELHRIFRENGVKKSLEVGLAYGYSTIWILDAISAFEDGFHIAVDPFEKTDWGGVGLWQVQQTEGFSRHFEWRSQYSIEALTDLIKERSQFDGIFIDGNHRFDDVLVDFYLADKILKIGGVIALDDMWMESIKSVVSFILENRSDYTYVPQNAPNMAVFLKNSDDSRDWHHFRAFAAKHLPFRTP